MQKTDINDLISALMSINEEFELNDEQKIALLTAVSFYVDQL